MLIQQDRNVADWRLEALTGNTTAAYNTAVGTSGLQGNTTGLKYGCWLHSFIKW